MAKTPNKKARKPKRNLFRNAASARASHARARPRPSTSQGDDDAVENNEKKQDTAGKNTLKTAGGAIGAALACAFIARENWIPPKVVTGLVSAVGGTLAVLGASDTLRAVGSGVMSAAGAQFGLMLIDDHYDNMATQKAIATAAADAQKNKKPANLESLPPGALESAYERARARLAMAQAASQMAA
jgi:hypothetical protein